MRGTVRRPGEAGGGCSVLAQVVCEIPRFVGRIIRQDLVPFPSDSAGQFLRLYALGSVTNPQFVSLKAFAATVKTA